MPRCKLAYATCRVGIVASVLTHQRAGGDPHQMAVSKKLRFEVFRRDNFACRYCGRTAMAGAFLEPDHVVPSSRGGRDIAANLVTACDACNSGKSDTPLTAPPVENVPQEIFRRACAAR